MEYFTRKGDEYKMELIQDLEDGTITFYQSGDFIDLCRGPHLPDVSPIKAIKLLSLAGAYWRGDENANSLHVFMPLLSQEKELDDYLLAGRS